AFAALGELAQRAHQALDAERAWAGVLRSLDARDAATCRALMGRAWARYRMQRFQDALADLDTALAIARELGDAAVDIAVLLERGIVLDWSFDFAGSAQAVAAAKARLAEVHTSSQSALALGIELGEARTQHRAGENVACVPRLRAVSAAAHDETEMIARLL